MLTFLLVLQAGVGAAWFDPAFMRRRDHAPVRGQPTTIDYFVDPEGVVIDCEVRSSHVSERSRERICANVVGRDAGSAPLDFDGNPAFGIATLVSTSGGADRSLRPDFEVVVSEMPGDVGRKRVRLIASIDESGGVSRCMHFFEEDIEFAQVACEQAATLRFRVRVNEAGEPVSYMDVMDADFVRYTAAD